MPQVLSHLKSCGWAVNEAKLQGSGLSAKFLGVVWLVKVKVIPHVVIDKIQAYPMHCKTASDIFGPAGVLESVCVSTHPLYTLVDKGMSWD